MHYALSPQVYLDFITDSIVELQELRLQADQTNKRFV
jgi:hypothetical protein